MHYNIIPLYIYFTVHTFYNERTTCGAFVLGDLKEKGGYSSRLEA